MEIISGIAIYFIIWWTVLFTVLPIGVRSQADAGEIVPGTTHSAPAISQMKWKMLLTTLISTGVFIVYYIVTQIYGFSAQSLPGIIPGT